MNVSSIFTRRRDLIALGLLCVASFCAIILGSRSFRRMKLEDEIHHSFLPLLSALAKYEDIEGHAASSLEDVLPRYLGAIPSSPFVDAVKYTVATNDRSWEVSLTTRALGDRRFYVFRSNQSEQEQRDAAGFLHGTWLIFTESRGKGQAESGARGGVSCSRPR